MAKNEIAKKGCATPASYNKKDVSSRTVANVTDIRRETYEPFKTTVEDTILKQLLLKRLQVRANKFCRRI